MKSMLAIIIMVMLVVGCGPNFNEVQIAKIQYDTARITALQQMETNKQIEVTKRASLPQAVPISPIEDKYANAGFLIETDKDGRIKTLFIGEGVINRGGNQNLVIPPEAGGPSAVVNAFGYQPKESYMGKEVVGAIKSLAKFGLIGYGINQIAGAVGDDTTTYTAGGDQSVNTGMNGVAGVTNTPVTDSYNDFSDNSDNRIDDNSDNRIDDNSDNKTDFDKPNDVVVVDPATPIVVPPSYPPTP